MNGGWLVTVGWWEVVFVENSGFGATTICPGSPVESGVVWLISDVQDDNERSWECDGRLLVMGAEETFCEAHATEQACPPGQWATLAGFTCCNICWLLLAATSGETDKMVTGATGPDKAPDFSGALDTVGAHEVKSAEKCESAGGVSGSEGSIYPRILVGEIGSVCHGWNNFLDCIGSRSGLCCWPIFLHVAASIASGECFVWSCNKKKRGGKIIIKERTHSKIHRYTYK